MEENKTNDEINIQPEKRVKGLRGCPKMKIDFGEDE